MLSLILCIHIMSPPSLGLIGTSNRNGLPSSRPPSLHDSTKNLICGDISDAFFNDMMVFYTRIHIQSPSKQKSNLPSNIFHLFRRLAKLKKSEGDIQQVKRLSNCQPGPLVTSLKPFATEQLFDSGI